jgi:hypothetical protein
VLIQNGATRLVPSGLRIDTYVPVMLTPDARRLMRWPAIPENDTLPFWPGVVIETVAGAPPTLIVAAASAGTSYSASDIFPVYVLSGSIRIVYVPLTGSTSVSTNAPLVDIQNGATRSTPSGRRMET